MSKLSKETLSAEIKRQELFLQDLDRQREEAQARLEFLRNQALSAENSSPVSTAIPRNESILPAPYPNFTNERKMRLFRELFRGREDVYPKYWENPGKKKKGYSPACANEWEPGLCNKKHVKCNACPNRHLLPVTDTVILGHFKGQHVVGVYPLLENEKCWFLAADFDKSSWKDDVAAFAETCRLNGITPAIERSRSGNGAHAWLFFSEPIAANAARRMGCFLITETMARRHQLSMESYDRLFPNQDTMPQGGFGNLIALPFQEKARQQGNTLFVDDKFIPWTDQWAFLSNLPKLTAQFVDNMACEASRKRQVLGVRAAEDIEPEDTAPWIRLPSGKTSAARIKGPLPAKLDVVLAQRLFIKKIGIPSSLLNQIKRLAAFQNPEFYKKQSMRLSTSGIPRIISCSEDFPEYLAIPRGCRSAFESLLQEHLIKIKLQDERCEGVELNLNFQGELTSVQKSAAHAILNHDIGIFVAPPGTGKTVLAAFLIAQRQRNTLVLVHRQQLLDQWLAQLALFLDIGINDVGRLGGGKNKLNGKLDVAMLQSLVGKESVDDRVARYGHVIVDECHHLPAFSFERVLNQVKAKFVTGLTATLKRRDGHHPITEMQLKIYGQLSQAGLVISD